MGVFKDSGIYKEQGIYNTGASGGGGGNWEELNYIDGNQNDLFFIVPGEISNYPQAGISETLVSLTEITGGEHWCSATFIYKQKLDQYSKMKGAFIYIDNSYHAVRFDFDVDISNINDEKYISFVFYTTYSLNRVRIYISNDKFLDVKNGNYYDLHNNSLSGIGQNARIIIKELYFE